LYPELTETSVFWMAWGGAKYQVYRYDLATDTTAQISTSGSDSHMMELDVSGDSAAWKEYDSVATEYTLCAYDGTAQVSITNLTYMSKVNIYDDQVSYFGQKIYDGTIPSLMGSLVGDGSTLWFYDIATETFSTLAVATLGVSTNSFAFVEMDLLSNGLIYGAQIFYAGRYLGISGMPSSDHQVYYLSMDGGVTNNTLISDYRYDGSGQVKLITEESIPSVEGHPPASTSSSFPSLPTRHVRHDLSPVMGDGIIAYHAYNLYDYYVDDDEIMVYDMSEELHYALHVDDPDIAPSVRQDNWAHVSGRNVAWWSQYAWAYGTPYSDEIAIGYWVGPDANLYNVDLSGEDLSNLDLTNADLTHADLSGADLSGTDLSTATLTGTVFSNATYTSSTTMPLSFSPISAGMILSEPTPITTEILSFASDGVLSWTNSVSNLYCGVEYTKSLTGAWHNAEAEGLILLVTGLVGSIDLPIEDIEGVDQMFFRLVASTNNLGDYVPYTNPIPQFVEDDYIVLDDIQRISRFRSGTGHDYSDAFESCRSMKHYYHPNVTNWSSVDIYSPVAGTILDVASGWAGERVMIKSADYPACHFIIFHVDLDPALSIGSTLSAGQDIGNHYGNETTSDIAVRLSVLDGGMPKHRLVSFFDVMSDGLFSNYVARGASIRDDFIISEAARTADPLTCSGESFTGTPFFDGGYGTLTNWVDLATP